MSHAASESPGAGVVTPALLALLIACAPGVAFARQAEEPSRLERLRGWIAALAERDEVEPENTTPPPPERGFFPTGGIIVSGSALAGGAGYRWPSIEGTPLGFEASGMYSIRGYELYEFRAGRISQRNHHLALRSADAKAASMFNDSARKLVGWSAYGEVRYRDYPRHRYFGLGPDTIEEGRSDYALFGGSYDGVVQAQLTEDFGVSARVGVLDLGLGAGTNDSTPDVDTLFPPSQLPGFSERPSYVTLGVGAALDRRDAPGDPLRGYFLGGTLWRFQERGETGHSFTRVTGDARGYLPVVSRGVIATRALVSLDNPSRAEQIPFYLQQSLGGAEILRGYPNYRFRDHALLHLQAEFRWPLHRFVELAPFVDAGTVGPGLDDLGGWKTSAGMGLRAKARRKVLFRMDWGASKEGQRLSFGVGPVF